MIERLRALIDALPRYNVEDTDNSCRDPECCGGPWPSFGAIERVDGHFYKVADVLSVLDGLVGSGQKSSHCNRCGDRDHTTDEHGR